MVYNTFSNLVDSFQRNCVTKSNALHEKRLNTILYIPVYGLRMPIYGNNLSQYGKIQDCIQAFFAL